MIKKVNIYDMDGTLVSSLHRYRLGENGQIDLQYWRDNAFLAYKDILLPLAYKYKKDLENPEIFTILATARVLHDVDDIYIRDILGCPNAVISRKENDNTSGGLLKIKGIQRYFNLKQLKSAKWTFYEDNVQYLKTVCDHFQINGVYIPSNQGH